MKDVFGNKRYNPLIVELSEQQMIDQAVAILRDLHMDETIEDKVSVMSISTEQKDRVYDYIFTILENANATPTMLHELRMGAWLCPTCGVTSVKYGAVCPACSSQRTTKPTSTNRGLGISEISNE